jgi:hypothetical protein
MAASDNAIRIWLAILGLMSQQSLNAAPKAIVWLCSCDSNESQGNIIFFSLDAMARNLFLDHGAIFPIAFAEIKITNESSRKVGHQRKRMILRNSALSDSSSPLLDARWALTRCQGAAWSNEELARRVRGGKRSDAATCAGRRRSATAGHTLLFLL